MIRASSLNGWADCPRRSAARIFRKEIEAAGYKLRETPRSIAASVGTSVHRGVAVELGEKATAGKLPPVSVPTDAAVDELAEQLAQGMVAFDGERGVTQTAAQAERQVVNMVGAYHRTIAPQVQPIRIERRLEAEIEPGFVLSGQSDLVAREPQSVRDLKTGTRSPPSVAPQLGAYSLLNQSHHLSIDSASVDFVQRVRVSKAQPDPVSTKVKLAHAETAATMILSHIIKAIETFRHGDAERRIPPGDPWSFPANPSSVLCSAKWCPAHGTEFCHEWQEK